MSVTNIGSNSTAQLQAYNNQKTAAAVTAEPRQASVAQQAGTADVVQFSEQAKALLSAERNSDAAVSTLTNGMGIEPPKTIITPLTNGMGIEPPKGR